MIGVTGGLSALYQGTVDMGERPLVEKSMSIDDDALREIVESAGGDGVGSLFALMMARELCELRAATRWRKWPDEKPDVSGRYLVLTDGSTDIGEHVSYYSASLGWATKDAGIAHWRPISPLPGGE